MVKIWVDDIRHMPDNYDIHCRSVNAAMAAIEGAYVLGEREILLDLDHDAGDFANQGGDYINILKQVEERVCTYGWEFDVRLHVKLHTMNPVGQQNMRLIIQANDFMQEVY